MKKELVNSKIDRQNILNNNLAINQIQEQIGMKGFKFEGKIWFTKEEVTNFFEVTRKTIDNYLESNEEELRKNGYEIFTGKRLKEAKEEFKREIDYPLFGQENGLLKAKSNLGMFDFRSFLNLGMILKESKKAVKLRQIILDITIDTINKKTGGNTKYINKRDIEFLESSFKGENYRQKFTDALKNYVDMGNIKYPIFTDKVYEVAFLEKAKEYKKILNLKAKDNLRETFYTEVLNAIACIENGIADELEKKSQILGRKLNQVETEDIFNEVGNNSFLKPQIEDIRNKMASRDLCFRDAYHNKLEKYISEVGIEDFEKFIGEKSKDFEEILKDTSDVIKRLKNK
ncbi:DNA-binding protein [Candidatus Vampirococcus lugosii]|uniref:DNA-binding protein n=1 Tax=Candidatus Vampirococcus lugosii TaxID=2789015 RepID=A0ABS5QK58_9BACT|nr:DNA-binding protein [Candidatus Vampirococcus lugosii]MBS8121612.1 DNA-binding protein [Candidatus Vampirococcus lugosii]